MNVRLIAVAINLFVSSCLGIYVLFNCFNIFTRILNLTVFGAFLWYALLFCGCLVAFAYNIVS